MSTTDEPRTVLITGASSGIGRAVAHLLAEEGAQLVLAARSPETLEQARQECVARGAAAVLVVTTDVADAAAVGTLFSRAYDEFGGVDGVVHAAAVLAYGRFVDVPQDVFDRTLATNIAGTANIAREALRLFQDQEVGSVVVVGSVLSKIAAPFMSPYGTSKWAVQGLVRTLQIEARAMPGIDISLVSPGGVNTPIYDQAGSYTGHPGHPPPPVYSPERVASQVVHALDHPERDRNVGVANPLMVLGFRALPGVYDVLVGPMMRFLGQGRASVGPHPGNVHEPVPDLEGVHGRWPRLWG
jgi:NAD(P)-dependent dehydrogenase (short-subunit alcohol dehydrogenase family)